MSMQQSQLNEAENLDASTGEDDNILRVVLGYYSTFVRPYLWLYPTAVILFLTGGFLLLHTAQPKFSSSSEILINRKEVRALSIEGMDDPSLQGGRGDEFIKTQERVIMSDEVLSKAYERLGSAADLVDKPDISLLPGVQIVKVTTKSSDPKVAAKFANIIVDEYLNFTNDRKVVINRAGSEALREQLRDVQENRNKAFEDLLKFKEQNGIYDFEKNYADQVAFKSDLMTKFYSVKLDEEELASTIEEVRSYKGDAIVMLPYLMPKESGENVTQFQKMLLEHEMKKPQLLTQYNESHLVIKVHDIVTEMIKKAAKSQLDVLLRGLELRRQRLAKRQVQLQEQMAEIERKLGELDRLGGDYKARETVCNKLDEMIAMLTNRLNELKISEATTLGDYSVCKINDAKVAEFPYFPNPIIVLPLSAILGIGFALMISVILVLLNNKVNSIDEAVRILGNDLTVFGSIPFFPEGEEVLLESNGEETVDEVFRDIRTSMHLSRVTRGSKIVALSSSLGGEGKTFSNVNLARSFSRDGKRILLMDFDMRKPRIQSMLKKFLPADAMKRGLSNVLVGDCKLDDVIIHIEDLNLDVVLAGPLPPNPNELVGSDAFGRLLEEVKSKYDLTFIDTPPIMLVSDTLLIASHQIPLLLVTRLCRLPKPVLIQLSQRLKQLKISISGMIVNLADVPKGAAGNLGYGGKYYSYGSYGEKYGGYYSNRSHKHKSSEHHEKH